MTGLGWLVARPIAHRGFHDRGAPENTLTAADAAVARGYAIECDVQLTADGEAVVFHDFTLDRMTAERGPLDRRDAGELGRIPIAGTAGTIPTLSTFLDRIGGRVPVVVEVKSAFAGDERLTRRTVEIVAGRDEPIALKSFDPAIVALLRRIAPDRARGIVGQSSYADDSEVARLGPERCRQMTELLHWDETRPDFVSWRHSDLPDAAPHLARVLAGVPVMTWTVRSEADRERARPFADQIVFQDFVPA